jgi:ComF family protein
LGTRWCPDCQSKVQIIADPICDACGLPQAHSGLCDRCKQNRPSFRSLRSWAVFEGPVQKALHQLKYRRNIGLGEALAKQMATFIAQLNWTVDVIVPIPLGKTRLKERGYNQVAMVARPLSLTLGMDYRPSAIVRARETRSQVGLTAMERKQNVQNAFKAVEDKVDGRTVLLMDDVSTTGATLSSAAEALYASGAMDVYAVTIARALPHHSLKIV